MRYPIKFRSRPLEFVDLADMATPTGDFYVVEQRQVRHGVTSDRVVYLLSRKPFTRNVSKQPLTRGWLGSTSSGSYGTDLTAVGRWRVTARTGGGFRFRELAD